MTTSCDPPRWRTWDLGVFHKTLVVYWHWDWERKNPNSQPDVWFDCSGIT